LLGTISDGDIRRGLLKGLTLSSPITEIIHRNPLVVPPEMDRELVKQLMIANKIQQIPVVGEDRQVVDFTFGTKSRHRSCAESDGDHGRRNWNPITAAHEKCPKPLLPIAGKPMLEHIIERAKQEGFNTFLLAIHYPGSHD